MSLLTAAIVKTSQIEAGIHFIFLKNVLDRALNVFNTKFGLQGKNRKQVLALFCKLVALL